MPSGTERGATVETRANETAYGELMGGLREALRAMVAAAEDEAAGVERANSERHAGVGRAQRERREMLAALDVRLEQARARIVREHDEASARARKERDTRLADVKRRSGAALEELRERLEATFKVIDGETTDALWLAETVDESNQRRLRADHAALLRSMDAAMRSSADLERRVAESALRHGLTIAPPAEATDLSGVDIEEESKRAGEAATALERMSAPTIANPWNLLIALILGGAAGGAIAAGVVGLENWRVVAAAGCAGGVALMSPLVLMQVGGRRRARALAAQVLSSALALRRTAELATDGAEERLLGQLAASGGARAEESKSLKAKAGSKKDEARRAQVAAAETARRREAEGAAEIERTLADALGRAAMRRDEALAESESLDAAERPVVDERCERLCAEAERHAEATVRALQDRRDAALRRLTTMTSDALTDDARWTPAWDVAGSERWSPLETAGGVARIGTLRMDLASLGPASGAARLTAPAWLELAGRGSLYIGAESGQRERALALLRTAAARTLGAAAPGRVRLTIIDPVGLGGSFAGFMRLLDHDPALVDQSVATDARDIEVRLAKLTDHVESVIQRRLRNEFRDIHAYNAKAGDLAEPFHVLLLADMPQALSEPAARSLARLCRAGARCGVFVLAHHDVSRGLPAGLSAQDLAGCSLHVELRADGVRWKDEVFGRWALELDGEPGDAELDRSLRRIGETWRKLRQVRAPFEGLAPGAAGVWRESAAESLTVPIGFCGPQRAQELTLGVGTRQHALVAGRTGSGKSTLLHTLIASVALRYSPDEVELHLIDFKKGVEFKPYATEALAHARVVAIESDREFGLSVLQRLDEELRERGRRFREANAQDVAGYRAARPGERLPRILLIVDEFQEFFVDDDGVAQSAALLLDRIVRQGRAFGMHVILGSQTLGGAYNLARSTIGQMAVRIALQSSEADASLILSEENRAAMDLTRPGEAIYNDESGAAQANQHFQVAWLSEDDRLGALARVRAEARSRRWEAPGRAIVFEGSALADIRENEALSAALRGEGPAGAPCAYLGDPVAIKAPTRVVFGRAGVSNLLVVGPREEAATATLLSALVSVLATTGRGGSGGTERCWWMGPAGGAAVSAIGGERVTVVSPTGAAGALDEALALIDTRRESAEPGKPAFMFFAGFQFLRPLWKKEDDYSFGADAAASTGKKMLRLLREGPGAGVHAVVWVDSAANLRRTMEREALNEFGHRVLFQMSGQDSSMIIDTPDAARLGLWRAILMDVETGVIEKFRPYEAPDARWLAEAGAALRGR